MASLPGSDAEVFFGDTEKPLPDWRAEMPEFADDDESADDDDEWTAEDRRAYVAITGIDPDVLFGSEPPTESPPP